MCNALRGADDLTACWDIAPCPHENDPSPTALMLLSRSIGRSVLAKGPQMPLRGCGLLLCNRPLTETPGINPARIV